VERVRTVAQRYRRHNARVAGHRPARSRAGDNAAPFHSFVDRPGNPGATSGRILPVGADWRVDEDAPEFGVAHMTLALYLIAALLVVLIGPWLRWLFFAAALLIAALAVVGTLGLALWAFLPTLNDPVEAGMVFPSALVGFGAIYCRVVGGEAPSQ
jgi:drug/metabolite transporter superfamily protein YnfA